MVYLYLNKMIRILFLIFLIRTSLIFLPSFHVDMTDWQAWAQRITQLGPIHFYSPDYFSDYFPGYLYILWFLGKSFSSLLPNSSIFSLPFEWYLKFITNIFDIETAYYIYKIVSIYRKNSAIQVAVFYLLNPALFFNSAVWGQVDGVLTFFLVASVYYLLELKDIFKYSTIFSLAILVKPQGLAIFPIILALLRKFKLSKLLYLSVIPFLIITLSLPFFINDPLWGLFHLFQKSASTYPYTSMFSYNLWSFVGWWIPDSIQFLNLNYQTWGIIFYFITLAVILAPLIFRKDKSSFTVYLASALASFAFFLFLTRIHQRYLFPFFSFLLIATFITNSLKLKIIYIILSLVHFINIWYVYYYYNYVYSNAKFSYFFVYQFLSQNYNLFTLLNLISFGLLILIYYQHINIKAKNVYKNS